MSDSTRTTRDQSGRGVGARRRASGNRGDRWRARRVGRAGGRHGHTVALFPDERVDALQGALGLSPSGVVRTVDRLVEAGLAERHGGNTDGREVLIHPTRRGVRSAERVLAARAGAVGRLLEPLIPTEREQLLTLLEKLLTGLPSDREDARHICRLCDHPACERTWCPVSAGAPGKPCRSHRASPTG